MYFLAFIFHNYFLLAFIFRQLEQMFALDVKIVRGN